MTSLEISNLTVRIGEKPILEDLSLSLQAGQIAALLGPSGCGKTTLLRSIAGLLQPSAGTIRFGKQLVSVSSLVLPSHRRKIGYVPQEGALFPHLDVAGNIAFGLDKSEYSKDERRQTVMEMLTLIGMSGFEKRMPSQISGGQQTRVALARALAIKPKMVLLDEPFSALDAELRNDLRSEVVSLLRSKNTTAVLVTHDREEALVSADLLILMRGGKIVQSGSPEDVYGFPSSPTIAISTGDAVILDAQRYADGTTSYALTTTQSQAHLIARGEVVIRPEEIKIRRELNSSGVVGTVVNFDYFGHDAMLEIKLDGPSKLIQARITGPIDIKVGEKVSVEHIGPIRFFPNR